MRAPSAGTPAARLAAAGASALDEALWPVVLVFTAAAHAMAACVLPLTQADAPIVYLTAYWDDFFYYLQIARNLAEGVGSTFDGVNPTNGYHPLWMLVVTALCAALDPGTMAFHFALAALIGALGVATALAVFAIGRQAFGLTPPVAVAVALVGETFQLTLARHGMEIALAVPLLLGFAISGHRFIERPTSRRLLTWALLGALTILARLDTAIAVASIGAALLLRTPLAESRRWITGANATAVLLGASPLLIYLAVNVAVFGTLLPISGQAKQLAPFPVFGGHALDYLFDQSVGGALHGRIGLYFTHGLLPALVVAPALTAWRFLRPADRAWAGILFALLVFPFALFATQVLLSDWIPWPWYLYGLVPALSVSLAAIASAALRGAASSAPARRGTTMALAAAIAIAGFAGLLFAAATAPQQREHRLEFGTADAALNVAAFAQRLDGRLAMGDRAARLGFLLPNRVTQLEGLVGTRDFLRAIRDGADLLETLRAQDVRYYVGTRMPRVDGCYLAEEPKTMQAGPHSPRLTGRFCSAPVFRHRDNTGVETLIFDVAAEP